MQRERLLGIQFARGLAALLVAIYHGCRMVSLPQYAGHKGFGGFFEFGYAGVDFFFVLSGFIIYYVHHTDLGCPQTLLRYGWRRVTRIYPSYWLVLSIPVALLFLKHDPSFTLQHFFRTFFLLPDKGEPMLGVAWTLVHEMLFYGAFALGIADLRLGILAAILWVAAIASGVNASHTPVFEVAGSILNLQFLMGIVAANIVLHARLRFGLWIASAGILAFLGTGFAENALLIGWASTSAHMIFGVCATAVIAGIATAERQGTLHVGRIGEFFGGTSYLLYLVHIIVIGFTFKLLMVSGIVHKIPDWISVLLGATCSVIVAGLLYRFYDLPLQATLSRFGKAWIFGKPKLD